MAIIGGAAITAAATIGSTALSKSKSGGGGGGGKFAGEDITTPAFRLKSGIQSDSGGLAVALARRGTFPQAAFDERFPRILSNFDTLRGTLRPGFSDLRKARLSAIRNARNQAIGTLRSNLARRKVLGSDFGEAALVRTDLAFAEAEAEQQAKSFLEELSANLTLLDTEFKTLSSQLDRELRELQVASGQAASAGNLVESARQFDASLAFKENQATLNTIGSLAGFTVSQLGKIATAPKTTGGGGGFDPFSSAPPPVPSTA